eukprot:PhM_4_TR17369/c2_g4_i1/m.33569
MSVAQPTLADPPEGILHSATLEKLKTSMRRDELYHVMYRRRHFVGEEPCATTDAIVKVRKSCTESDAKGYAWWVFVSPVPSGKPCRHAFPQVGGQLPRLLRSRAPRRSPQHPRASRTVRGTQRR